MPRTGSPQRILHVVMSDDLIDYLKLKASREQTSVSWLVRDMVKSAREKERAARRRRRASR